MGRGERNRAALRARRVRRRTNQLSRPYQFVFGLSSYQLEDRSAPGSVLHLWMGSVFDALGIHRPEIEDKVAEDDLALGAPTSTPRQRASADSGDAAPGVLGGRQNAPPPAQSSDPDEAPRDATAPAPRSGGLAVALFSFDALALQDDSAAGAGSNVLPNMSASGANGSAGSHATAGGSGNTGGATGDSPPTPNSASGSGDPGPRSSPGDGASSTDGNGPSATSSSPGGAASSSSDGDSTPAVPGNEGATSTGNQSGQSNNAQNSNGQGNQAQGHAGNKDAANASKHALNTPVLHTVRRLGGPSGKQLFVQGLIRTDAPVGSEVRIDFFAAPVAVVSGDLGFPEPFAFTTAVKRNAGVTGFSALVDADFEDGQQIFARAEGRFEAPAKISNLYDVKVGGKDADRDGVVEEVESLATGGDANRDGQPDDRQQDVAAFPAGSRGEFIAIDGRGNALRHVQVEKASSIHSPHRQAPVGLIHFEIPDLQPGASAVIDIVLPEDAGIDVAYKTDPTTGAMLPFTYDGHTGAVFQGDVVTLHLVDGGRGDADGLANGVIVDPLLLDSTGQERTYIDVHGWSHFESGGSGAGAGSIQVLDGDLVLAEGNSFEVSATKRLVIPSGKTELQFEYRATFSGDKRDRINDAFEVALVDDTGKTLTPAIRANRDSFFNLTENLAPDYANYVSGGFAELGALAVHEPITAGLGASAAGVVTLDVSRLADGVTPRNLVVRLVNNDGDTGTTVSILGNRPPLAKDDGLDEEGDPEPGFTTSEDVALTLNVSNLLLANDIDPDGDLLTLHRARPTPAGLLHGASPLHGALTLSADGASFLYDPDDDFYGTDTFEYWAFDGLRYSEFPATVTVTVTRDDSDPPIAQDDQYQLNTGHQAAISGNVLGNDIDVDRLHDDPSISTLTAALITDDPQFPVPSGLTFYSGGNFTYAPPAGVAGEVKFKYQATDAEGQHDDALVTITVEVPPPTNQPPSIDSVQLTPINKSEGSRVTLVGTASDLDLGDTLTAEIDWQDGSPIQAVPVVAGEFSVDHVYADNGTYTVLVDVKDSEGAYAEQESIAATIVNAPPTLSAGLSFQPVAGKGNQEELSVVVNGSFTDPGFTALSTVEEFELTIDWGDGTSDTFEHDELNVAQGGIAGTEIRLTSGSFSASHEYPGAGPYTVTVTVTDDDGGSDVVTLVTGYLEEIWIESAITPSQEGRIPVRIGPNNSVDVSLIDISSLRFGPAGAKVVEYQLIPAGNPNKLHLKFNAQDAGIPPPANGKNEMRSLFVTGTLYDGTPYVGMDTVHINAGPAGGGKPAGGSSGGSSSSGGNGAVPKFFVADAENQRMYRYSASGQLQDSLALAGKPRDTRGLTIFDQGSPHDLSDATLWSVDQNGRVVAQTIQGQETSAWRADRLSNPQGIATDGTDVWIVDAAHDKVFRYASMAHASSKIHVAFPTDSFVLDAANGNPSDISTDGQTIWVVDDSADRVFVYDRSGALEGSWPLDALNADPSSITGLLLNSPDAEDQDALWIVDRADLLVYKYAGAKTWRSDQDAAAAQANPLTLAAQNTRPEAIADPEVNNQIPIAQDDHHYLVQAEVPIKIYALNQDYDTDGDRLFISDVGTPTSGSAQISAAGDYLLYTPDSGFSGDSFQYTVDDGYGGTDTATIWLHSGPLDDDGYGGSSYGGVAPQDDYVYLHHLSPNAAFDIYAFNNDFGVAGQQITSVGAAGAGTVQISGDGKYITYTPSSGYVDDSFTYTVDDNGYGGTATIWIEDGMFGGYGGDAYGGSPPVAEDDAVYDIVSGVPIDIYVMDNDWDPDQDTLTIVSTSPAQAGTVQIAPDGSKITYTAGPGFISDSFTYTIEDGNGNSATATVYLEDDGYGGYGGSAPVAAPDGIYGVTAGIPLNIFVLSNDYDDDGDPLTIVSVTDPQHGTAVLRDGYITYTPSAGFAADSFDYTISDGNGNTATATVFLDSSDPYGGDPYGGDGDWGYGGDVLTAVDDFLFGAAPGAASPVYVLDNDWHSAGGTFTITAVGSASAGAVQIGPTGDHLLYTPASSGAGDSFTYTIADAFGRMATATVHVENWYYDWQFEDSAHFDWFFTRTQDSRVATQSPALDLARAMTSDAALVTGAAFVALPPVARSYAIADEPIGLFQEQHATGTYAVLSTGEAALVNDADASASFDLKGGNVRGNSDYDVTILKIDLNVPQGVNYLSFDFQFLSEEFPLLFSEYNDAFIAELDNSTWTVNDGVITAPNNFAVFGDGSAAGVLDIDASELSRDYAQGTAFTGAAGTPVYRASTPITPGAHSLYLSIFDQSDTPESTAAFGDTAVLLDNLRVSYAELPPSGLTQALTVEAHTVKNPFDAYSEVLITGQIPATIENVASVTVNGQSVDAIDAANHFFAVVTALPGLNHFEIVVTDVAGTDQAFDTVAFEAVDRALRGTDWDLLTDASASVAGDYRVTSFDDRPDILFADVAVTNNGLTALHAPLLVGVKNLSRSDVHVLDYDGITRDGIPYFNLTRLLPGDDGVLNPGDTSQLGEIAFSNPAKQPFTYDLVVLGRVNKPPRFVTAPVVEVIARTGVANEYFYDVNAYDENQDPLTYSILAGPSDMALVTDPATGNVTLAWDPQTTAEGSGADIGTHWVTLQVKDPHGGYDLQHYLLRVRENVANRPPFFTTTPIQVAYVGQEYVYPSAARDLDGDALAFSVDAAGTEPDDLTIETDTGIVRWRPGPEDVDALHHVSLVVTETDTAEHLRGTQEYDILVLPDPTNLPPVIISDPQRFFGLAGISQGTFGQVTPSMISLRVPDGEDSGPVPVSLVHSGIVPQADVFLLFDDTGSFEGHAPRLIAEFPDIVAALQYDLPGVSFGFGVGRFEDYLSGGDFSDLPYILDQPILVSDYPNFANYLEDALQAIHPGKGGSWAETLIEGLYQTATGLGYGGSVPTFADFLTQNPSIPNSGTLGGAGFRLGALPIILAATDAPTVYVDDKDPGDSHYYGGSGSIVAAERIETDGDALTTGAGVQATIDALVNLGARVIGIGTETSPGFQPRLVLEAIAELTGAINSSGQPINSGIANDQIDPGDPFYFYLPQAGEDDGYAGAAQHDDFYLKHLEGEDSIRLYPLNNDWHSEGEQLTIVGHGYYGGEPGGGDPYGGDPYGGDPYGGDPGGSMEISTDGRYLLYTPPSSGPENTTFTYTVVDENGHYFQGTISLYDGMFGSYSSTGADNNNPVAQDDDFYLFHQQGAAVPIQLHPLNNDYDADGQLLTISSVNYSGAGTVNIDSSGKFLLYTPPVGGFVDEDFTYEVSDGSNPTDSATIHLHELQFGGYGGSAVELSEFAENVVTAIKSAITSVSYDITLSAPDAFQDGTFSVFSRTPESRLNVAPGGTAEFDATFYGNGMRHRFDLLFTPVNGGTVLGRIPVSLNDDYRYDTEAIDPENDDITYSLRLSPEEGNATINPETGIIDWTPPGPGTYSFIVRATDTFGGFDDQAFDVVVANPDGENNAPDIISTAPDRAAVERGYRYQVAATDSDNDPLTYLLEPHPDHPSAAESFADDAVINPLTGLVEWNPETTGTFYAQVRVTDGRGLDDVELITVTVTDNPANSPPQFTNAAPTTGQVDEQYDFLPTAADADGDRLVFGLLSGPRGMVVNQATGRLLWTPAPNQIGSHPVRLRVADPFGGVDVLEFSINVTGENLKPFILSDPPTNVVIEGRTFTYPVIALDPNDDPLTYTLTIDQGKAADPSAGNVVSWTPAVGDAGVYTLTVSVSDGELADQEQFTLTVVSEASLNNNPPSLSASMPYPAVVGQPYRAQVNGSDPDGDTLEYRLDQGPAGMTINASTGELLWPEPVNTGLPHKIVVSVHDGRGGWAKFEPPFELPVTSNRPPEVTTLALPGPATQGVKYQATIEAFDPDGDAIQFTLTGLLDANGDAAPLDANNDGVADITLNADTGVLTWDAPATASDFTVQVRVADTRQDSFGSAWIDVNYPLRVRAVPANRPPIIDSDKQYPVTPTLGNPYEIQIAASDPDGDEIHFDFVVRDAGGATVYPGDPSITTDADTGRFLWNAPNAAGEYTIEVTVTDDRPDSLSATATLEIEVIDDPTNATNHPPVIDPFNYATQIEQNATYTVRIPASDEDGDSLTWSVVVEDSAGNPLPHDADSNGTPEIKIENGLFTWSSTGALGAYTITATVDDGRGGVATAELEVDVVAAAPNNPPVFLTLAIPGPATEGVLYKTRILAEDPDGDPITGFTLDAGSLGKNIEIDAAGVLTWTPTASHGGAHTILVTATDARGASRTASFPLSVQLIPENSKPVVLTTGLPRGVDADPAVLYESQIVAADPDGEPVTVHLESVTGGAALQVSEGGVVTWADPVAGTYTLTVYAKDSRNLESDRVTLTLEVLTADPGNNAPVIGSFQYPGVVIKDQPMRVVVPATDAEGDQLAWSVEVWKWDGSQWVEVPDTSGADPGAGKTGITIDDEGNFVWNAPPDEGTFKFAVTVSDPFGGSDTAPAAGQSDLVFEVRASAPNTAPTGNWPASLTAVEDRAFEIRFPVTDAEGDPANYSVAMVPTTAGNPAPTGEFEIDATGHFTWDTPGPVQNYTLTVTVRDSRNPSLLKSQDIALNVIAAGSFTNNRPEIDTEQTSAWSVAANHVYQKRILAHDPDHDPIHYSVDAVSRAKGITIDDEGLLRWTPNASHATPNPLHTVEVTVTDGQLSESKEYDLEVVLGVNAPPTIDSTSPTSIAAGQTYIYKVKAHDPDGDPLEYVLEEGPPGMGFDPNTEPGVLVWKPAPTDVGKSFSIVLKVYELQPDPNNPGQLTRNEEHYDVEKATLKVVTAADNQEPEITSTPARVTLVGRIWGYDPVVEDPDDTDFVWALDKAPGGMAVHAQTGAVRWDPASTQVGTHEVILRVTDARGASDTQKFQVEVRLVNGAPDIRSTPEAEAYKDITYIYAVNAVDPENDPVTITAKRKLFTSGNPYDLSQWADAIDVSVGADKTLRWTPATSDVSDDWWVLVRASDGIAGNAQVYPLNVLSAPPDDPPEITSPPILRTVADGVRVYRYPVVAHDPNGTAIAGYNLGAKPNGFEAGDPEMTIDAAGVITWTPLAEQVGEGNATGTVTNAEGDVLAAWYPMRIEATSNGQTGWQEFNLLVRATSPDPDIDAAPHIAAIDDHTLAVGEQLNIPVEVSDLDLAIPVMEEQLVFELLDNPEGLQIDRLSGWITWTPTAADKTTPPAGHTVTVRVTDRFGLTDQDTFQIFVTEDVAAPTVSLEVFPGPWANLDEQITFRVTAVDNVDVESLKLVLQGATINETLTLDGNGVAYYTPTTLEPFTAVAIARDAAGNEGRDSETIRIVDPSDTNPPSLGFDEPGEGDEVTAPVAISGWINDSDNNLVSWTLSLVPRDRGEPRVLAENSGAPAPNVGSPASPATLATLDPTMLANGVYDLILEAVDAGGEQNRVAIQREIRIAGDLKLGNFNVSFQDLTLPAPIPITVTRTYDTLNANTSGDFGYGWSMELSNTELDVTGLYPYAGALQGRYRAFQDGTRIVITLPNGAEEGFTFFAEPVFLVPLSPVPNYYLPRFIADNPRLTLTTPSVPELTREGSSSPHYYTSYETNYNPANFDTSYTLTLRDGTQLFIDTVSGDLLEVEDRTGNILRYDETGITSAYREGNSIIETSRGITILRDNHDRIKEIRLDDDTPSDHTDNQRLLYKYDTATGDLVAFYDRQRFAEFLANPSTTPSASFEYKVAPPDYTKTVPHYLTKITDARGVTALSLVYDTDTGRIENLADASGAEIDFGYTTDLGDGRAVETNAAGNTKTELVRDDEGNLLRQIQWLEDLYTPGQYTYSVTVFRYTDPNDPKLATHTSFPFEVTTTQVDPYTAPDPNHRYDYEPAGGPRWQTVIQFTADGKPLLETDALGNTAGYSYNDFGQQETITIHLEDGTEIVSRNDYDPDTGVLRAMIDPEGTRTRFDYTNRGLVERFRNHAGTDRLAVVYNEYGEMTAAGASIFAVYDEVGNQTLSYRHTKDENGADQTIVSRSRFDDEGRIVGSSKFVVPGVQTYTTASVFDDANGNEITTNRVSAFSTSYTATGQVHATTDEFNLATKRLYNLRDQQIELRTQTDPDGQGRPQWFVSRTVYDALGRATHSTDRFLLRENADGTETIISTPITGTRTKYDSLGRVTRTERLIGLSVSLTDNDSDGIFTSEVTAPGTVVSSTETHYDARGRTDLTIDEFGAESRTVYDAAGQVIETRSQKRDDRDAPGSLRWSVTRIVYDAAGREIYLTDPFLVSGDGNDTLLSSTITGTHTTYDKAGQPFKTERLEGLSIAMPAVTGLLTSTVANRGVVLATTESVYNDEGQLSRSVSIDGQITEFEYDDQGRQIAAIGHRVPAEEVGLGAQHAGKLVRLRTETQYNQLGQQSRIITNIVQVEDAQGNLVTIDRSGEQKTDFEYDERGNRLKTIFGVGTPVESYVLFRYDDSGRPTAETQQTAAGVAAVWSDTQKSFIVNGSNPVELIPTKRYEYDDQRRLTAVELPAVADPQNSNALTRPRYEFGYATQGNQTLIRDPLDRETLFTFDSQGRPLSRTLPLGAAQAASLIQAGQDVRGIAGDLTAFTEGSWYDDRGRPIRHVSFEGVVAQMDYDDAPGTGRLREQRFFATENDFNNNPNSPAERWTYKYDAFGREVEVVQDADGDLLTSGDQRTTAKKYDVQGRLTEVSNDEGVIVYGYDNLGRQISMSVYPAGADTTTATPERTTSYTYDALGRLKTIAEDLDPSSGNDEPLTTVYTYDLLGNLIRTDSPNGVITDYKFDQLNRVSEITHYAPDASGPLDPDNLDSNLSDNQPLTRFTYELRDGEAGEGVVADGRRIAATETFWLDGDDNPATPPTPHVNQIEWSYDNIGRLTDEVFNHFDDTLDQTEHFVYDLVGNRLEKHRNTNPAFDAAGNPTDTIVDELITYVYDANDRLTTEFVDADVPLADGVEQTTTYGYNRTQQAIKSTVDAANNPVSSFDYSYDLQGRLAGVKIEQHTGATLSSRVRITYEYDATGIRVGSDAYVDTVLDPETETWTLTTRTEFLFDHQSFAGYQQAIKETVYDANGEITKRIEYTFGHDEIAQTVTPYVGGNPDTANAQTHIFGHDAHGSVRVLFDLAVVIAQVYAFDAYGQMLGVHNGTADRLATDQALTSMLYSGERFDPNIQQQYLRARFYDPATGRFNRLDDFAGNPLDPQSFHKYGYAHGDPVGNIDPTGMFSIAGFSVSFGISSFLQGVNAFSRFAAKQFAISVLETTVEVVIGKLLSLVIGVPFEPDEWELLRTLGTNFVSNLVTAGIGNKTKRAIAIRNILDFSIRVMSDVFLGGQNVMWAAATNLIGMAASGLFLLSGYGKKVFGECLGRFGGCFVEGTPIVVTWSAGEEHQVENSMLVAGPAIATRRTAVTEAIEKIRLGQRVITEAPEQIEFDTKFGEPDPFTWRQINLLQQRADGTEIEMELLRPAWWIDLVGLQEGTVIELPFPELQTVGYARVLSVANSTPIEAGEGRVVIGRFVTRKATNLLRVILEDGNEFTGTTTHPVWSVDRNDWVRLKDIEPGDQLATLDGNVSVVTVEVARKSADVHNLEVHGEHVYRLLAAGILVHNTDYFPNTLASRYADEVIEATSVGAKVIKAGAEGFDEAISEGTIKFVLLETGELLVSPKFVNGVEISHAFVASGRGVKAAGEAEIAGSAGSYIGLLINNHSGHYLPDLASLTRARDAFAALGITFPT